MTQSIYFWESWELVNHTDQCSLLVSSGDSLEYHVVQGKLPSPLHCTISRQIQRNFILHYSWFHHGLKMNLELVVLNLG